MLIQLLADITRNKKLLGELVNSPEKALEKYPALTKKHAQILKKRDLNAITAAVTDEVSKHFAQPRFSVLYFGLDIKFDSITPSKHKINDVVPLTMVLNLSQSPISPGDLASSVVFNHRSDSVSAKVKSTAYNKRKGTITIKMDAQFSTKGSYSASVKIWAVGAPKENTGVTTKNIFVATAS